MTKHELIEKALETARHEHDRNMTLADMGGAGQPVRSGRRRTPGWR